MASKNYLLHVLVLLSFYVEGQELRFSYVGDKLGLPSQECYNVMQDSKGYIWISTEAGLCRYNGSGSKIFGRKNGLSENACYVVKEDTKNRIWILTSGNHIYSYLNDTLREAPFSKSYCALLKGSLEQNYALDFKGDSLVINSQTRSYITGPFSKKVNILEPAIISAYYFIKNKNELLHVKNPANRIQMGLNAQKGNITFCIKTEKELKQITIPYKSSQNPYWRVLTAINKKGDCFIANGTSLINFKPSGKFEVTELPGPIISLYSDCDNGLWAGTIKGGIHYFSDTDEMQNKTVNLPGFSVSGVCVDKEKGVWCTTLEKGVFYCRNKDVLNYSNTEILAKPVDLLKYESGNIFSARNGELVEFRGQEIKRYPINHAGDNTITDLLRNGANWFISGKNFVAITNEKFTGLTLTHSIGSDFYSGANELALTENGRLFCLAHGSLIEIVAHQQVIKKLPLESPAKRLLYIGNSLLLYGCKDGLYRINFENGETKKIKGLQGTVTKMIKSSDHEIWVATKEDGLYVLKNDSAVNITSALKLQTENFFDLTEDRYGTIWLGSNIGLLKIAKDPSLQKNNKKPQVSLYTTLNGLPYNEIYKVAVDSTYIYLSGTEGVCRLSLTGNLSNEESPNIYINSIKINDIYDLGKTGSVLPYNYNSLKIGVDALTYKELNTATLYYQLKGGNRKALKDGVVRGNVLSLDNLLPDVYELSIYAINAAGIKSRSPATLFFEIQKPLWEKAWFIIICIGCFAFIIYLLVSKSITSIRKKEEEKTQVHKRIAELQLTALQAQMNPHFIFNAINSIQTYILENESQAAYNYLAKFSKLVRLVLMNAKENNLTLEKEIEMLEIYVELEQMRFENKFDFELSVSSEIDTYQTRVPPMLVQPFIENAIWHGLMPLKKIRKGKLKMDVAMHGSTMRILIEDNGIGREASIHIKKTPEHRSIGMELTQERITILQKMQGYENAKIIVTDLQDTNGTACGTRIEIFLPKS